MVGYELHVTKRDIDSGKFKNYSSKQVGIVIILWNIVLLVINKIAQPLQILKIRCGIGGDTISGTTTNTFTSVHML